MTQSRTHAAGFPTRRGVDATTHRRCSIHIGGVCASRHPTVVRTVLGSCISVCLRDPVTQVGGMNHFMLPGGARGDAACARYGIHAMELLINECMKAGAERTRLEAKVFGGGHVLRMRASDGGVPQSNIRFALDFLKTERVPIMAQDLGGYAAREIYFFTDSGRTLLRRLAATGGDDQVLVSLEREERSELSARSRPAPETDDSNITLF